MSLIFVFGAGASYGEQLRPLTKDPATQPTNNANPPLTVGFFSRSLYDSIGYTGKQAEADFKEAFEYIRWAFALSEPVGEGRWASLNVEDVFTGIELDREFRSSESDAGGRLIVIRNKLVRYLWRIIADCTQYKYGEYYRRVKSFIDDRIDVSILNFNWDLLLDQEFMVQAGLGWEIRVGPYQNFSNMVLEEPGVRTGHIGEFSMFLKMHGSLDWFQCTNPICPNASKMEIMNNTQDCLYRAQGIDVEGVMTCERCGTDMNPLLIPPLLRKPVNENWIIRAVWGHARQRLQQASKAVIVGFSAPPTDFYAAWLFRSTLGIKTKEELEVFVVNPQNEPGHEQHKDFSTRMATIFPHGYNSEFLAFSQIESILERLTEV